MNPLLVPLAHGIVGREDLPIEPWVFGWAAASVLVISFVAPAILWPSPRLEHTTGWRVLGVPRIVEVLCGLIGIALFGVVVWAGLAGAQSQTANLAPTFIFVLFWVGIPVASVLFGDIFRAFDPWRGLGRGVGWIAKRVDARGDHRVDELRRHARDRVVDRPRPRHPGRRRGHRAERDGRAGARLHARAHRRDTSRS